MPSYVVTGASRGLGYAFVKALAANPLNKVIGLVRNKKTTEDRLTADGITNALVLEADITDESALKLAAEETRRVLGHDGLDILINNAGYVSEITALKSLKDFEGSTQEVLEDSRKSFEVNLLGTMKAVFAFLPLIRDGGLKKVVAISSGMGDIDLINEAGLYNAVPYAVSKASQSTLFAKFHASFEGEGILFISLCPGLVDTAEGDVSLSEENLAKLKAVNARFEGYAPGFRAMEPAVAAEKVLVAIERSSLREGFGGSFLSHNGTKRWM